jgi:hypothetical protein
MDLNISLYCIKHTEQARAAPFPGGTVLRLGKLCPHSGSLDLGGQKGSVGWLLELCSYTVIFWGPSMGSEMKKNWGGLEGTDGTL